MTSYEISAIIGFWRMGASECEMSYATGIPTELINEVIKNYQIKNQLINHGNEKDGWQENF